MKIFKQLNKKGYKHYYEGTVEELDSMDKDNQHLHSEIMQVIMWLYDKHDIWIDVVLSRNEKQFTFMIQSLSFDANKFLNEYFNSPTEAYEVAINYCLNHIVKTK